MKMSKIGLSLLSVFLILFISCNNSEDENEPLYSSMSDTKVKSFYLSDDTASIVDNLSSRFFTIDLASGNIYNADSLPYGTNISRLVAKMEFVSPSKVEIYVKGKDDSGNDKTTTINYLETPSDSIDFSGGRGSVTMTVVAADGTTKQDYVIDVRVHQVKADSLIWESLSGSELPVANAVAQKTVMKENIVYCFTQDGSGGYALSKTATPGHGNWQKATLAGITDININTIVVSPDGFYALSGISDSKTLISSSDGITWAPVSGSATFYSLIGMYENTLLGIVKDGGTYKHASYPQQGEPTIVPADFPVSGFSNAISYKSDWGTSQIVFVGGRLSDGNTFSNSVWGFDGENWVSLNNINGGAGGAPLTPREGAMFFAYYTYKYNSVLDYYIELQTYFIIGGSDGTNVLNDLYTTTDLGGFWTKVEAGSSLSLPHNLSGRAFASVVVCEETIDARSGRLLWKTVENPVIPRGMRYTRALTTEPVPFIYMFGGVNKDGVLYDEIWRGVIRRLTFEPIP
ncbi:DUF6242 domain-containing protein [Coprobacter sp.]